MPYREIFFEKNQPFHVISRAVEERKIFEKEEDCYRFLFQIYAANVGKPAANLWREDVIKAAKSLLAGEEISSKFVIKEHPPLVYILDFSLVITHYHLYLVPTQENSIPLFIKKLNGGFAKYFNLKHGRKGALFGARYKCIPVKTESQSEAVSRYVSIINPLDIYQPDWREKGIKDWKKAFQFLETYPFSSFLERIQKRNSKIVAPKKILKIFCGSSNLTKEEYQEFVKDFLKYNLSSQSIFLE